MLDEASRLLGAVDGELGSSCVLDLGLGQRAIEDFLEIASEAMSEWKLAATSWFFAEADPLKRKLDCLRRAGVVTIAGGTAGEIAADRGAWDRYVDLCARVGFDRVEIAEGFTRSKLDAPSLLAAAARAGVAVQYEVGRKDADEDAALTVEDRLALARRWLDAGVTHLVVEAREVGHGYGMFNSDGHVIGDLASALVDEVGLDHLIVETPNRATFQSCLRHFGPHVRVSNVAPGDLLRFEMMRRCIHADTYALQSLWAGSSEARSGARHPTS